MNNKQRGYYAPKITMGFVATFLALVGIIGWAGIEFILWLFSFVTISVGV